MVVYGLSRGNRTAEYARALCDEVDVAFGDDTWDPKAYMGAYWRTENAFVHSLKLGTFFLHASRFAGATSSHDLAAEGARPGSQTVLFMCDRNLSRFRPDLERSFTIAPGVIAGAPVIIRLKRIEKHVPENEQLIEFMNGTLDSTGAFSLLPKEQGR